MNDLPPRKPVLSLDILGKSRLHDLEIEAGLEAAISKFDIMSVVRFLSVGLRSREARTHRTLYAPHWVARSIAAACAYHRNHYRNEFELRDWLRIRSGLARQMPAYQAEILSGPDGGLHTLFALMYKEQIELQHERSLLDFYRSAMTFGPRSGWKDLVPPEGFPDAETWVTACGLIWHVAEESQTGEIQPRSLVSNISDIFSVDDVRSICRHISLAPSAFGKMYRDRRRDQDCSRRRSLSRPVLLDYPCIVTPEDTFVVPLPQLVGAACYSKYARALSSGPKQKALATRIEGYVDTLMLQSGQYCNKEHESSLAKKIQGKVADRVYFAEGREGLIVEVKATFKSYEFLSGADIESLRRENLTKTLSYAALQIGNTRRGLAKLGVHTCPIGLLVTPLPIVHANSPEIRELITQDGVKLVIADLAGLELAVAVATTLGTSVDELMADYLQRSYVAVGEFDTYVLGRCDGNVKYPAFMRDAYRDFWEKQARKVSSFLRRPEHS